MSETPRPRAPLTKAYLRDVPNVPPHRPGWIIPGGWAIGIILVVFFDKVVNLDEVGAVLGIAAGWTFVQLMLRRYAAKTPAERNDDVHFKAIKKLKSALDDGFERRLPPEVLLALERATVAHNAAASRITLEGQFDMADQLETIHRVLHGAFVAAITVMRDDHMWKKEWRAILENKRAVHDVVDIIDKHADRLRQSEFADSERLAALRELGWTKEPEKRVVDGA